MSKEDIIEQVYYSDEGFGSIKNTLKDAKAKDKSITLKDVQDWFKTYVPTMKQPTGTNSFVAPHHGYEYQIDLIFIKDLPNQKLDIGLSCVDIFSKYAAVAAIRSKKPADVLAGIMECLNKMGKKPKIIYSDDEGSLRSKDIMDWFEKEGIFHHPTRGSAHFVERFNRTFRDLLFRRLKNYNKKLSNPQWPDFIDAVLKVYNTKMEHTSTKMTPSEARKKDSEMQVKSNLEMRAKRNRKYPEVKEGDKVKLLRKRERGEKETTDKFTSKEYEVSRVEKMHGQDYYYLRGINRPALRAEILKV